MKKIVSLFLVAVLGGVFSLAGYKLFIEKSQSVQNSPIEMPVQNVTTAYSNALYAAEMTDFTTTADQTLDAVVHVQNKSVYSANNPIEDLFYGRRSREQVQIGIGSGVIITSDGYIITNNHVIENASEIEITLNDKKTYQAELIGTDPTNDIALIKVDANDLPYVTFGDSDEVKVGEWVLAVGNPYNLTATVTAGIISAKGRDLLGNSQTESYLQTDAVVNSGNSGGALVNTRGELIGINTMITSTTGSYIGYSFAVPSNIAKKVIEDILEFGNVQRAYIGINFRELDGENYTEFNVDHTQGVIVTNVIANSGASDAGLLENDIIVKANNVDIETFADLSGFLKSKRPNDTVDLTVVRNGEQLVLPVNLKKNDTTIIPRIGLQLQNLSKEEARAFDLDQGVKITAIYDERFVQYGLREGEVLKRINNEEIRTIEDAENAVRNLSDYRKIGLEVLTENGEIERYIFN